jgi:oligosaccharyltransferase complex subunit beta
VHAIYEAEGQVGGKRTLVLLDSFEVKETHSLFFAGIAARGHTLTYLLANSPDVVLYKYGEPVYDNLFLFAPSIQEFATLTAAAISGFVQKGGNLIMAGDKEMSDLMREVAADFGVELDKRRALVTDHFSYEPKLDLGGSHVSVVSSAVLKNERVVGKAVNEGPFVYRGIGHTLEKDNVLAMRVLTGASSTYSAVPGKEIAATGNKLETAGSTLTLISAIQGRNNARVVFCGSLDFFSDAFFTTPLTTTGKVAGNKALALELSKWGLGERGILRASNVTHHRADG